MSFSLDLKRFEKKTSTLVDAVVRKIVIDVATALVYKSPVGDADYWIRPAPAGYVGGRFRANWQFRLSAPDTTTSERTDQGGGMTIAGIVGKIPKDAAGKVHYITNSLPYGKRLEEGWSRQAPHGMVGLTVIEFRKVVNDAVRALT